VRAVGCVLLSREGGRWRDVVGQRGEGCGAGAARLGREEGVGVGSGPQGGSRSEGDKATAGFRSGPGPMSRSLVQVPVSYNLESRSAPTRALLGSSPDGWAHKILRDLDDLRCLQILRPLSRASGKADKLSSPCQDGCVPPAILAFSRNPALEGTMPLRVPQMPRPTRIKYQTTRQNSDVDSIDRGCEPPCKWE